jgi:hypothetical protein
MRSRKGAFLLVPLPSNLLPLTSCSMALRFLLLTWLMPLASWGQIGEPTPVSVLPAKQTTPLPRPPIKQALTGTVNIRIMELAAPTYLPVHARFQQSTHRMGIEKGALCRYSKSLPPLAGGSARRRPHPIFGQHNHLLYSQNRNGGFENLHCFITTEHAVVQENGRGLNSGPFS